MSESIGEKPVLIDGSRHSGSGSLLRTALILSSLTKIPFDMINIKKNRSPSGLSKTDLQTISIFQKATKADVKGAGKGSETLAFYPTQVFELKKVVLDIEGSLSLQIQALMIASLFSHEQKDFILENQKAKYRKTLFECRGKTHSPKAPNMTFLRETLVRILHKYAFSLDLKIDKVRFSQDNSLPDKLGFISTLNEDKISLEDDYNNDINDDYTTIPDDNDDVVSIDIDTIKEDSSVEKKPFNVSLRVEGKYTIEQAPSLLLEANDLIMVKGEFFASKHFANEEILEKLAQLASLSLQFENSRGIPIRAMINTRYVRTDDLAISMNLFAYYGNEDGFDNDNAFVVAKDAELNQDFEQAQSILNNLIKSFKTQVLEKQLDSTTSAFLIPVIGLIGGTFETNFLSPELLGNIYVTEKLLDISFNLEANIISTSGHVKNEENALNIEDL